MVSEIGKLYLRGTVSNGLGLCFLALIAWGLDLYTYVAIACGMQYAVFLLHGLPQSSEKFYDLSGSFTHFAVVAASLVSEPRVRSPRQIFTALSATVWMTRLGSFLYSRILRDGKDSRFDQIKKVWLSFMGAWTLQALWVTSTQLPALLINSRDDPAPSMTWVDYLAMSLWLVGFLIEAAADSQKMAFRDRPENKGRYITSGLWRYSRHPNYFGEILMWCSQALCISYVGLQSGETQLLAAWLSPALTAVLLLKVSGAPMVEQAGQEKWGAEPAYAHYVANTSFLVPWMPAGPGPDDEDASMPLTSESGESE